MPLPPAIGVTAPAHHPRDVAALLERACDAGATAVEFLASAAEEVDVAAAAATSAPFDYVAVHAATPAAARRLVSRPARPVVDVVVRADEVEDDDPVWDRLGSRLQIEPAPARPRRQSEFGATASRPLDAAPRAHVRPSTAHASRSPRGPVKAVHTGCPCRPAAVSDAVLVAATLVAVRCGADALLTTPPRSLRAHHALRRRVEWLAALSTEITGAATSGARPAGVELDDWEEAVHLAELVYPTTSAASTLPR